MSKAVIALIEHMGDCIAAEPAARWLKAQEHHVTWVSRAPYLELLRGNPNIDEVVEVECLSDWAAMDYEKEYDIVADMHFEGRLCGKTHQPVARRAPGGDVRLENYYDDGRSLLGAFCVAAGLPELDTAPKLWLPEGPAPVPGRYAVFHCDAVEDWRKWRRDAWRMLAFDCCAAGLPVVEVGTTRMLAGVRGVTDMTGVLTLGALADAIRGCALFVGCESGPAHMANALQKECLIVSGSYRTWKHYNPYTGRLREHRARMVFDMGLAVRENPYPPVRTMLLDKIDKLC